MAIFKCKMCGGDLEVSEGISVIECEYCETKQTIPCGDNEKKLNLFNRANRLRMNSEFDKAAAIYESIVAEFPEEAEAYWGLCLCNYGIEYVDDPATARKIPTCHRASFESLQNDENFELALEYADVLAQKVYRDEAREIDRIMQEILAVSKNEKPYDVFICYKETDEKGERTVDSVLAYDIYDALTAKGYNVFFSRVTLEDKLGRQYEPYIFAALNSAKVMLSIGTKYEYFHAVWVKNEWSRFLKLMAKDKSKMLIPCYKDIDAYDMPDEFKALQAQDMGKLGAVQDIVRGIEKIISDNEPAQVKENVVVNQSSGPNVQALLIRGNNALEDGKFNEAKTHFDKVLDIDAECAQAYLGLAMTDIRMSAIEKLAAIIDNNILAVVQSNSNYKRAKQYADNTLSDKLAGLEDEAKQSIEKERIRREKAAEEERIRKEKEAEEARNKLAEIRAKNSRSKNLISAGMFHSVGLKSDGTVVAVGRKTDGQCNVSEWENIVAVAAGDCHTVGLKSDGTVVAVGSNEEGSCNVLGWNDIVTVETTIAQSFGLKSNGTVVATGYNADGQCNVSAWKNIVEVSAGGRHTVGLKSDGTVVAVGFNEDGQCNVSEWENIVAIATGMSHTVGLKSDGTVVAVGFNGAGQCSVSCWKEIVAVAAGSGHTMGLKSDGTVVAVGRHDEGQCNVSSWNNIVSIKGQYALTVGLKSDGTVVATGVNEDGQCKITGIKLFDSFKNLEEERIQKTEERKQILEEKRRIEEQKNVYRSQGLCPYCGGAFKGLFIKKCINCGKEKDY